MFKKASAILLAICMIAALTVTVSADEEALTIRPWQFCGALLDVEAAGLTAGAAYTLVYEVEADVTTGFRVRYSSGDGEDYGSFAYNDETNGAHSSAAATASGRTASQVPAFFDSGTIPSGAKGILTVNFVFSADIPDVDPNHEKFIGLFGLQGGADFEVLGVALYDASGTKLLGAGTEPAIPGGGTVAPPDDGGNVVVGDDEDDKHGADTGVAGIATVVGIAAVATVGIIVSVKKRK
ncbi:MAG: hypothetical protein LBC82_03160 [Oscillospiraceae bacterium]|nr:hypothetical protein [Oscillospiraceae bacterium]